MTMTDRGVHPDLLEEVQATQAEVEQTPAPAPARRSRRGAQPPPEPVPAPTGAEDSEPAPPPTSESEAHTTPPEWLEQVKNASDPKQMLALLTKNLPKEDLSRDDVLAGMLGDLSNRRAKALLQEQEQQRLERERLEAYQRGDLYALGQHSAAELQERQRQLEEQSQLATSPLMRVIRRFQEGLPPEVQQQVQGRTYAPDGTPEEGLAEYLRAVVDAAKNHGLDDEIKRREPALRKALLSDTVGSEPAPETESGQRQSFREITDEQLSRMSLEETDQYLDDKGRPLPGVRVRNTRGINLREQQR